MLYENSLRKYEKYWLSLVSKNDKMKFKKYVIENNIHNDVSFIKYHVYMNRLYNTFDISLYYELSRDSLQIMYNSLADKFGFLSILEALRINNAKSHRVSRLRSRIESIISYPSLFLTLTFTNKVLRNTSSSTRRKYVTRFLKSISTNYVANIDFGSKKGREHYHAVVMCELVDHNLWSYGAINFQRINYSSDDTTDKLSLYIAKLTNHAIKVTNKRCCLIYPKVRR